MSAAANSAARPIRERVNGLLRQAEEILTVACTGEGPAEFALLRNAAGELRILEGSHWSAAGLRAEFGAGPLFQVKRRAEGVTVEAWERGGHCLLERRAARARLPWMDEARCAPGHMMRIACSRAGPSAETRSGGSSPDGSGDPAAGSEMLTNSQSSETHRWLISRYSAMSSAPANATRTL